LSIEIAACWIRAHRIDNRRHFVKQPCPDGRVARDPIVDNSWLSGARAKRLLSRGAHVFTVQHREHNAPRDARTKSAA
jgi:hypothetical protein